MIAAYCKKSYIFFLSLFLFFLSVTTKAQVVLNEVMAQPSGATTGPSSTQGLIGNGKEYIELYNKGCTAINVAGYFIACRSDFASPTINGGTFQIPNVAAATIPAKGHLVIGNSISSTNAASVDIVVSSYVSNYCIYSANFLLSNSDGWVGLYDAAGNPIDALYWASASTNISQAADFGGVPCVPTGSAVVLESAQQINTSFAGVLSYLPLNATSGVTYSRIPDGGTWTSLN